MADVAATLHSTAIKAPPRRPRGAADWLGLAAAPIFAIMALMSCVTGNGQPEMLCSAAHGGAVLSGMVPMYLLMSVFHSAPWFKLFTCARLDVGARGQD